MSDNIKNNLYCIASELDPNALLELAKNYPFEEVLIIGVSVEGDLFISGNNGDIRTANLLLDLGKHELIRLQMGDD